MRRTHRGIVAAVVIGFVLAACAHVTGDPIVVNAERVLKIAPAIYDAAMTFAEQNKPRLSYQTLVIFEKVRVNFPPAYRSLDDGLPIYKAAKLKDPAAIAGMQATLEDLLNEAVGLVKINGGPDLTPKGN